MLRQSFSSSHQIGVEDTKIEEVGPRKVKNPRLKTLSSFELMGKRVLLSPFLEDMQDSKMSSYASFEIAGPKKEIYFDPSKVRAGIVTCGGICPGLNNVIRAIVLGLYYNYGCTNILGFMNGFEGFIPEYGHPVIPLDPGRVTSIHTRGGTILGTSRGPQSIDGIVDTLERMNVNQLFIIGGDGTLTAAEKIAEKIKQRGLKIALVGIPKTIDNDIPLVSESFGFDTAVEISTQAISSAHVEATSSKNGIGLVKLMGRYSGFIAAVASLAQRDVNFVFIPEKRFELHGPKGFLEVLKKRMLERKHAVIVVAEGAGQDLIDSEENEVDASGNKKFKDIGLFLKDRIEQYFKEQKIELNLKYIDPSYMIRSTQANTHDGLFAATLAQNAVHAAMAGYTNLLVSIWHGVYCYVPLKLVNQREKRLSLSGRIWLNALESTGQPDFINDEK